MISVVKRHWIHQSKNKALILIKMCWMNLSRHENAETLNVNVLIVLMFNVLIGIIYQMPQPLTSHRSGQGNRQHSYFVSVRDAQRIYCLQVSCPCTPGDIGKCKFYENRLFNQDFAAWLKLLQANSYKALRILSKTFFKHLIWFDLIWCRVRSMMKNLPTPLLFNPRLHHETKKVMFYFQLNVWAKLSLNCPAQRVPRWLSGKHCCLTARVYHVPLCGVGCYLRVLWLPPTVQRHAR